MTNDEEIRKAVNYSLQIARDNILRMPGQYLFLKGKTIMEIGPGNDLGVALILMGYGARMIIVDKYLLDWDNAYHPSFYEIFLDSAVKEFPGLDTAAIEEVMRNKSHTSENLQCYKCGLEELTFLPEGCIDVSVSQAVMEHLYNPELACRELFRVTKPGGSVFTR